MATPKILLLDIETTPNTLYFWDLFPMGPIDHDNIVEERHILSAAWKWLGEKKVHAQRVVLGTKDPDKALVVKLLALIAEADAVVAHNGDRFDIPWIMTRAVALGLKPPPPTPSIDTWKIAKFRFRFNNNKLDYLAKYLGCGKKIKTDFGLWKKCMAGDKGAMDKMVRYNKHDVVVLEKVFLKLRPYVPAKINAALFNKADRVCPGCGEAALQSRGIERTKVNVWSRYQCTACGAWSKKPMKGNQVR